MLFPTHLVAAGLLSRVSALSPVWLVVGAALPDLVDKPLGALGVTTLYHSVGHSVLLVGVAVPVALAGATGRAVAVGWGSHLALDVVHVVVNGRPEDVLTHGWPLVAPAEPFGLGTQSFLGHYLWTGSFWLELLVWAGLAIVIVSVTRDGRAGDKQTEAR